MPERLAAAAGRQSCCYDHDDNLKLMQMRRVGGRRPRLQVGGGASTTAGWKLDAFALGKLKHLRVPRPH